MAVLNMALCAFYAWQLSKSRPDLNVMRMAQDLQDRLMAGNWTNYVGHITNRPDIAGRVQENKSELLEKDILETKDGKADTVAEFE